MVQGVDKEILDVLPKIKEAKNIVGLMDRDTLTFDVVLQRAEDEVQWQRLKQLDISFVIDVVIVMMMVMVMMRVKILSEQFQFFVQVFFFKVSRATDVALACLHDHFVSLNIFIITVQLNV